MTSQYVFKPLQNNTVICMYQNHAEVIVRLRHSRFETLPIAAPRKQPYNEQAKYIIKP